MDWRQLSQASVKRFLKEDQIFLAVSVDGQAYSGKLVAINDRYVELENGPHKETLYLNRNLKWTSFELPGGVSFGVADPSLSLIDRERPPGL